MSNNQYEEIPGLGKYLPNIKLIPQREGYCQGLSHSRKYTTCGKDLKHDPKKKAKGIWQSPWCEECSEELAWRDERG